MFLLVSEDRDELNFTNTHGQARDFERNGEYCYMRAWETAIWSEETKGETMRVRVH